MYIFIYIYMPGGTLADLCCFECLVSLSEETHREVVAGLPRIPG